MDTFKLFIAVILAITLRVSCQESVCFSNEREGRCFRGFRWRFVNGECRFHSVCSLGGANKFRTKTECQQHCTPTDNCVSPPFEAFCYAGRRWRFDPATGECEQRAVCNLNGPNTHSTKQACMEECSAKDANANCSAPAIHPTMRCVEQYAWRYNGKKGVCERAGVCPLTGPNKYETEMECLNACQSCSAPATLPNVRCVEMHAWRYDGVKCEFAAVCPAEGANRYSSERACRKACSAS